MAPIATSLAALLIAAGGGGSVTISDKTGDSHGAPDITGLTIGVNDSGRATFRVAVKLPAGSKNGVVSVFIDADNNPSTGSPADGGADFVFAHYQSDLTFYLYKWDANAAQWAPVDMSAVSAEHDTSGVSFSVNRSLLGDASNIRVFAKTAGSVGQIGSTDRVPDTGWTAFDLAPFTLKVAGFHAAETGGKLTLTMAATRSDNGNFANGVKCAATAVGSTLHARTAAVITLNGVPEATCVWAIGKTLKGKTLHASITESSEGRPVTKTATLKAT